jgi:hypothetical protein
VDDPLPAAVRGRRAESRRHLPAVLAVVIAGLAGTSLVYTITQHRTVVVRLSSGAAIAIGGGLAFVLGTNVVVGKGRAAVPLSPRGSPPWSRPRGFVTGRGRDLRVRWLSRSGLHVLSALISAACAEPACHAEYVGAFCPSTRKRAAMPEPPIIVFDVNETLLNLDTLRLTVERIFNDPAAMSVVVRRCSGSWHSPPSSWLIGPAPSWPVEAFAAAEAGTGGGRPESGAARSRGVGGRGTLRPAKAGEV